MEALAILLVDDDTDVTDTLAALLRRASFNVVTASSVPEAVSQLEEHRFDVVVTDYDLNADENGGHLLSHVAQRFPAMGRVLCSSSNVPDGVGAHAHIGKPPRTAALIKVILALSRISPTSA